MDKLEVIRCSKCLSMLPASTEYFAPRPSRRRGFTSQCRKCINDKNALDPVKKLQDKTAKFATILDKKCNGCKVTKPIVEFRRRSGRNFGWVNLCLACERNRNTEYRQNNAEYFKDYHKTNRNLINLNNKKRYYENRDSILAHQLLYARENREILRARVLKHYRANKHKYVLASRRKEVAIKNVSMEFNEFTEFVTEEIYKLRDLRTQMTGVKWQVDHIVPLQSSYVQGLNCGTNLQLLTQFENISKGNRWWPDMPEYTPQDKHELKYYKWLAENADLDNSPKL